MTVELPRRERACPAALDLESFVVDEAPAVAAHLAGCDACRGYVEALREEQAAFLRARPREQFVRQVERRAAADAGGGWRWRWWAGAGVALAASLVAVLALRPGPTDDVVLKGSAFRVLVRAGDGPPTPLRADQALAAGDVLRFAYQAPRAGWLLVLDLDGTERVTALYPTGGVRSAPVLPTEPQPLPGAVTLDNAPGPEWLVAIFSDEPLELGPLQEQLGGQSRRAALEVRCGRCQVETLRFQRKVEGAR